MTPAALDALANASAIHPRSPHPSPALTTARNAVSNLIVRWDDRTADSLAAGNLVLDRTKARRRDEIAALRATVGACTPGSGFESVENAWRGRWTMNCERGKLEVAITLAPTMPPRVQYLEVRPAPASLPRADECPQPRSG